MIRYEDECVGCGLPCLGSSCPYKKVRHLYCDRCGGDAERLYWIDGEQLCEECIFEVLEEVTENE